VIRVSKGADAASAERCDDGWIVTVRSAFDGNRRLYYPYSGGAWELRSDGALGNQCVGTKDDRAPHSASRMRTFLRRLLD
jgi:hypothetical protein